VRGAVAEGVRLPVEIGAIRREDPERARMIQAELADQFEAAFTRGLAVIGVERDDLWFTYLLGDARDED
jgi:predicted GNAT superfamily acetyltransferase